MDGHREGYFQFGVGRRKFDGKGLDQFELGSMFNQLLPDGQSLPLLFSFVHDASIPYVLPFLSPTIRHFPSSPLFSAFLVSFSLKGYDFFASVFCIRVCMFFFLLHQRFIILETKLETIIIGLWFRVIEEMIIATVFCFPLFFLFSLKDFFAFVFCIRVCIFFFSSVSEIYNFRDEIIITGLWFRVIEEMIIATHSR